MVSNLAKKLGDLDVVSKLGVKEFPLKWCSISLSEVAERGNRLEASSFSMEAKSAIATITNGKFEILGLLDKNSLVTAAYHAPRFKRNYVKNLDENSVGFLGSAEMLDINPIAHKFITRHMAETLNLYVKKGTILLSCSGTIGNLTYVNRTLEKFAFSQHIIRLECSNYSGYVYALMSTPLIQAQLRSQIYGSVIQEIEPEHLRKIIIPNPPNELKQKIHNLITRSFELRDESNDLIDKATKLLVDELQLPPVEDLELDVLDKNAEVQTFGVKLSEMNDRLDASYHVPIVDAIVNHLKDHAEEVTTVGDERISYDVVLPGRFKRVYVEKEYGVKFIGGKEISQLDPSSEKYLSKKAHKKQLDGPLGIKPFSILTPARGSLGEVALSCQHFYIWAISDNMMQILSNSECCGYTYIFLNSDYGKALIQRYTYGGVVDAIEPLHIKNVQIPLLKNKETQKQINDLALEANDKRFEAYKLEQQAMKIIDNEVIYAK